MVDLVVTPPQSASGEPLFLAADHPTLGGWVSRGQMFSRLADGRHHLHLDLPQGSGIRYLITKGHWRAAELDEQGKEQRPRELTIQPQTRVDLRVYGWGRQSIRYHHGFGSNSLPAHRRTINVYLPPGYDLEPSRRYPVLYMHDGQNLFDSDTAFAGVPWRCDEEAEAAIRVGDVAPLIIVGVGNTPDRLGEYGPRRCGPTRADDLSRDYGHFLVDEVKPFIDGTYRTQVGPESTGVGGASMGGLISLHLCKWYPRVFGKCLAMSPSLWWNHSYFLRTVRVWPHWLRTTKVWLDMGGREGSTRIGMRMNVLRARVLARVMRKQGVEPDVGYHYHEDSFAGHNEAAWGGRFAQALRFLFPLRYGSE